jgi:hypothetical protein
MKYVVFMDPSELSLPVIQPTCGRKLCRPKYRIPVMLAGWFVLLGVAMIVIARLLNNQWPQGLAAGIVYIVFATPAVALAYYFALIDVYPEVTWSRLRRIKDIAGGLDGTLRILDFTSGKVRYVSPPPPPR